MISTARSRTHTPTRRIFVLVLVLVLVRLRVLVPAARDVVTISFEQRTVLVETPKCVTRV